MTLNTYHPGNYDLFVKATFLIFEVGEQKLLTRNKINKNELNLIIMFKKAKLLTNDNMITLINI